MNIKEKLIVALDVPTFREAESLVDILSSEVDIFKVGIGPFTAYGSQILEKLQKEKKKIFLDLKFHDIPNTVKNASRAAAEKGVFMMNFHCLGGRKMLEAAVEGAKEGTKSGGAKPILIGVTILTSMSDKDINSIGVEGTAKENVLKLAKEAKEAGLDGVVSSAQETSLIKKELGKDFVVVTPGIRPAWAAKGDQERIVTPKDALENGSDYIVVGRPIIQAENPLEAAIKIKEEMKK